MLIGCRIQHTQHNVCGVPGRLELCGPGVPLTSQSVSTTEMALAPPGCGFGGLASTTSMKYLRLL